MQSHGSKYHNESIFWCKDKEPKCYKELLGLGIWIKCKYELTSGFLSNLLFAVKLLIFMHMHKFWSVFGFQLESSQLQTFLESPSTAFRCKVQWNESGRYHESDCDGRNVKTENVQRWTIRSYIQTKKTYSCNDSEILQEDGMRMPGGWNWMEGHYMQLQISNFFD